MFNRKGLEIYEDSQMMAFGMDFSDAKVYFFSVFFVFNFHGVKISKEQYCFSLICIGNNKADIQTGLAPIEILDMGGSVDA